MAHWLNKDGDKDSTRKRSDKQETKIAKRLGGRKTSNSGATFGQNDIITPLFDIEAKTTKADSFSLKANYFKQVKKKAKIGRTGVMVITFEEQGEEIICMNYNDFLTMFDKYLQENN